MRYTGDNLTEVLKAHKRWIHGSDGWTEDDKADFSEADLRYVDLSNLDLSGACFNYANLNSAVLSNTKLCGAKLHLASLRNADMWGTDLRCADLGNADMCGCNMRGANLSGANIRGANLLNAILLNATNIPFIPLKCPEVGAFIGWKRTAGNAIVKLQITEDAKRSSATSDKCRCSKAIVLAIENPNGTPYKGKAVRSKFDKHFLYVVGETIEVRNFDDDRWNECSTGIHFFINRQQAVEY